MTRDCIDGRYEVRAENGGLRYGILEVTTACQLRCPGCYMVRRHALNRGGITLEAAIRVLDLCKEYRGSDLETMDLLGGEPLLWSHLKPYIEVLLTRGIKPWIFTNMLCITPELARWLLERGVHVTGKLNIADPEDPAQLALQAEMIGGSEATARKMIGALEVFREAGYGEPLLRLQNLVRRKNLPLVPGYIRFCREKGVGFDLELMGSGEPIGPEYFAVAPTAKELADLIGELERSGEEIWPCGQGTPRERLLMPHVFGSCPFYDKGLYFAADGHIRACSNSTVVLAHVDDPDPIRKAYESPLICARRKLTKTLVGEPCRSCDRFEKCRGGCRATVEGMGDPFGGYTLCPLPILRERTSD